jgi:hypothetical protein
MAIIAAKPRHEILDIVAILRGRTRSKQIVALRQNKPQPIRPGYLGPALDKPYSPSTSWHNRQLKEKMHLDRENGRMELLPLTAIGDELATAGGIARDSLRGVRYRNRRWTL